MYDIYKVLILKYHLQILIVYISNEFTLISIIILYHYIVHFQFQNIFINISNRHIIYKVSNLKYHRPVDNDNEFI